jgi:thiol-disulfide isomerase/thioredoxin
MKRALGVLVLLILTGGAMEATAKSEKVVCPVCRVMRGETAAEPMKATRTHEGKDYGFCSKECAKTFDADPIAFVAPVFPRPIPSFVVTNLDGMPIKNADLSGKVVLVDFWATWCAPCVKALPGLQRLHEKLAGRGFEVVGISIDEGGLDIVKRFVSSKNVTYPIAVDSKQDPAWEAFRVKVVPSAYLVDRAGQIVAQWTGTSAEPGDIETAAEKLLDVPGTRMPR